MARDQDLISKYINRKELPPSCFVVTADKWAEWSGTRGMAGNAMGLLQRRLQEEGKTVLWPIVARARDVGMLHPKGYSMKLRRGNVFAQKNTFLTSGDLEADGVVAPVRYEKRTEPLLYRTRERFQAHLSQSNFPLHTAAFFGQTDAIQALLDAGVDPNARTEDGFTPLHIAARRNKVEAIQALINAGADHNARKSGKTPLHWAARQGQKDAIAALIDAGADPNARDEDDQIPFDLIPEDSPLVGTSAYRRLRDAPRGGGRLTPPAPSAGLSGGGVPGGSLLPSAALYGPLRGISG